MPKDCLFPGEMSADPAQLKELKEQSNFAMATVAMREGRHEEALKGFEALYTPRASYYTGLVSIMSGEIIYLNHLMKKGTLALLLLFSWCFTALRHL